LIPALFPLPNNLNPEFMKINQTPVLVSTSFLDTLDATVAEYDLLTHPFYQQWTAGTLPQGVLAEYAKQYFAHVKAFPTYVSAVHSNCDRLPIRQMLLENLLEEEQGVNNHPELWLRFAEGLGVDREAVHTADLLPTTVASVNRLRHITRTGNYLEGLAALYAYESQIPKVAESKRLGLKQFYGIDDNRTVAFFSVHEQADVMHREVEREVLASITDQLQQQSVLAAATEAAQALWQFLDGVEAAYLAPSSGHNDSIGE
jgi:pyrroloquinoline-quinone synthase